MLDLPLITRAGTQEASSVREYLSFTLGSVDYGIDILTVQEIRSFTSPTRIAHSPVEVLGVMNLRGVVVPIVDLRLKLDCANAEYNLSTVVIVLNLGTKVVGVVADSVSDVVRLEPGEVLPAPDVHTGHGEGFITGMATVGERMLILVDAESLLCGAESASPTQALV
ncbi:chemotaxis protein CheW [Rhodoferax koreense]|uniref:Chemotaxis protein CheW n=1 Tax=Rhodoferax koreensis TaxID=1842727 RepID=A0A1P8K483_9BURK|nr:chemotaxis protein CheW [Rhodoferax koreense]APW40823.1 chemotaxis protein CheW [Rhodoferax koreense]